MDPGQTATETLEHLKTGIQSLVTEIEHEPAWRMLTDPATPHSLVQSVMREIYAEIAAYQPDVIEATIAVIGQFPRSLDPKTVRAMLVHQAEEWDHGEMAVRDYVGLNRAESDLRGSHMTLEYIEFHSTEDIRHAKVIDAMIRRVVQQYPHTAAEVKFGFDAFRQVYPLPGWRAAAARPLAAQNVTAA